MKNQATIGHIQRSRNMLPNVSLPIRPDFMRAAMPKDVTMKAKMICVFSDDSTEAASLTHKVN